MSDVAELRAMPTRSSRPATAFLLLLAALGSGCASLTYQPKITVGLSPERMPLRIEVRDLRDSSPAEDRSRRLGGTAATASDTLAGELSTNVTDAIIENFVLDEVFDDIGRRPEKADLIMTGTIRRFYGKANQNLAGWVAFLDPFGVGNYLALLGLPVYSSYGQVDLELSFEAPDGQRIAAYSAMQEFSQWSSMYRAPLTGIGTKVNRAFSQAVADVRQQMLAEREKLLQSRSVSIGSAPARGADAPGSAAAPDSGGPAPGETRTPDELEEQP